MLQQHLTQLHIALLVCAARSEMFLQYLTQIALMHSQFYFYSFSSFQPHFGSTVWRSFGAWISSNLVSLERSRCLVSMGLDLVCFGATVIKISRLEGRWRNIGNLIALFLENSFLLLRSRYRRALFTKIRWLIILKFVSGIVQQLWLNQYNFLCENALKIASFFNLKIITFNQDFGIFLISHLF